ncbi:MAG: Gfo/Idh/MocA family oxidoreductase [Candidatus Hydrogenedentes bacterium]|nr:Gfo/Idh/MocA family oxidoreductase [Candidatus Hydrogenedentota bacterium]
MAKIGIMSCAHMHAYAYAGCVKALPDAELVAIWDDDSKRGRAAAREFGTKFIADLQKFLSSGVDAVIVCSENSKHRPMVEAAAKAGKWVLCEKPLATTVADAKAMIRACSAAGVGLGTAFPCRFITPVIEARNRLKSGEIGRLHAAACTNNGSFPGGWFADPKLSGGGAVMDHTVHVVDALRWMTGKEFTRVYCDCGTLLHEGLKTDDVGSLHLEMEDGVIVSHVASWNRAESFPTWGDVTFELVGSKGVLSVDGFNQKIDVYSDRVRKTEWAFWGDDANLAMVKDFVDAVDAQRPPSVTGEDGLRALEVTLAAYRSAKSGKMVAV